MDEFKAFAKKYPRFTGFIATCSVLFIAGLVYYFIASSSADKAHKRYTRAKQDRDMVLYYLEKVLREKKHASGFESGALFVRRKIIYIPNIPQFKISKIQPLP